jgi:inosine-uridine nucleoside N-ribohydrolase
MAPQKVLFFLDADKDDYYSLCLIAAQHYYGVIDVIGVIVDCGFVPDIQDGLSLTQQWLNKIQVATNLDKEDYGFPIKFNLYAGYKRDITLENRLFPKIWTNSFIMAMKPIYDITLSNFDYSTGEFTGETIETGAPSADVIFNETGSYTDKCILCLTTGAPTTLGIALDKFPFLSSKLASIYCMASNYLVHGNVPPGANDEANITLPNPYQDYNGEYNAFMNPYALQRIALAVNSDVDISIVPLDCTNYANLNPSTIDELKAIAEPFYYYIKTPWVVNLCNYFISLLETTLVTINSPLYLWDLCATEIALGSMVDQYYILGTPIIDVSGKIRQYYYGSNDKVKIYTSLSYRKLLVNSIRIIFNDVAYKV